MGVWLVAPRLCWGRCSSWSARPPASSSAGCTMARRCQWLARSPPAAWLRLCSFRCWRARCGGALWRCQARGMNSTHDRIIWQPILRTAASDTCVMISNRASEHSPAPPKRPASWLTWLILAAIVALGAAFCTLNLYGWDSDTGQHPDERFMATVADRLKMPTSLAEYLDSSRNPLNPRNSGNTFYVYGLLPQTLTHLTAVLLTPQKALRPTVRAAMPSHWDSAPQVPNPDLRGPRSALLQVLLNPSGADLTSASFVHHVGRSWSALFQLLSIVVVFLIGRRLYGKRVGLLAALFLALAALPIQL